MVLLLQLFVAAWIVHRVAFFDAGQDGNDESAPRRRRLRMQLCTVGVMCPLMSLAAIFLFKRPSIGVYIVTSL